MRIEIAAGIENRFRKALRSARRREIGGMLFAEQLAPGSFRLTDFSIDEFSGSHLRFRRDPTVHSDAMNAFFERTGRDYARYNYLGEWHSHPSFSVNPSPEDVSTMMELVSDGQTITFAALLIVRLRLGYWVDHTWTMFSRNHAPQRVRTAPRWV